MTKKVTKHKDQSASKAMLDASYMAKKDRMIPLFTTKFETFSILTWHAHMTSAARAKSLRC